MLLDDAYSKGDNEQEAKLAGTAQILGGTILIAIGLEILITGIL